MTYWIVNENGENIRVKDFVGDDGCIYKIENGSSVRIEDDAEISGTFDVHDAPFA